MMNQETAEQIGREAFAAGKGNHPLADARIAEGMIGARPGERTHLMQAFNRGWTAANLAAPVEMNDETRRLRAILGLDRTDDERRDDNLRTAAKADAAADRIIAQARAAIAAGDLTKADDLLNTAQSRVNAGRHYRAKAQAV